MTIDERAAACFFDIVNTAAERGSCVAIIARHLREAVAERDALLAECRHLLWHHGHGEGTRGRIDALIGKDEDES